MDVLLVAKTRKEPGPALTIRCPKCGADGVAAVAYRQVDDLCAFYFLQLFTITNTFVECSACRAKLRSSVDLDELAEYPLESWISFFRMMSHSSSSFWRSPRSFCASLQSWERPCR